MLADMLLEMSRPSETLLGFEKSMKTDPNRFSGLYGAGKAAESLGQGEKERSYYAQLLKNCAATHSKRLELTHAAASLTVGRELP
jgi:hypothetical protein